MCRFLISSFTLISITISRRYQDNDIGLSDNFFSPRFRFISITNTFGSKLSRIDKKEM